jgi:hypothetical protein
LLRKAASALATLPRGADPAQQDQQRFSRLQAIHIPAARAPMRATRLMPNDRGELPDEASRLDRFLTGMPSPHLFAIGGIACAQNRNSPAGSSRFGSSSPSVKNILIPFFRKI